MTTQTMHKHKAKTEKTHGWTHCVSRGDTACSGESHGGVTRVAVCSCGARRSVESNGRKTVSSGWVTQGEKE